MGMIVKYCTPVSQVGFVGDRNPPPSLPSIPVACLIDSVLTTVLVHLAETTGCTEGVYTEQTLI